MDDEQIQAVARIRYVAHECLRDQVAITVANMQSEVGKRIRGKEKVRRKGMGKRRRKDDAEHYNSSRLNPTGRLLTYHTENEMHPTTYVGRRETDDVQASPVDHKVDEVEVCDDANEVDDSHFRRVAEEAEDDESSQEVGLSASERPCTATEVVQQSSLEGREDVARQVEAH